MTVPNERRTLLAVICRLTAVFAVGWMTLAAGSISHAALVANWKLNEQAGLVANDSSGNSFHGTLTNMDPSTDWVDASLDFDGLNDRVTTPVSVGTTFTWSAWFRMRTQVGYDSILTIPNSGGAADSRYMLMDVRGTTASFWANDGLSGHTLGVTGLQVDVWYQLTFVREGDSLAAGYKAYLNGTLQGTRQTVTWSSVDPVDIGARRGVTSQTFDGQLAEVHVYDHALTAPEVAALYLATKRPGLVGQWKLGDGTGSAAADSSGSNHHGSVVGSANWATTCNGSGALDFDGLSDYVTVADHSDFNFDGAGVGFTAAAMVQPRAATSDGGIVGRWQSAANSQWLLKLTEGGTRARWMVRQADGSVSVAESAPGALVANRWVHVLGLAESGVLKIYIDGVASGTTAVVTGAQQFSNVDVDLGVANRSDTTPEYFDGLLRDVRIYNLAISEQEIVRLAGAMIAHWKLDETTGTTAADSSGMNHHGTLVGGPVWTAGTVQGGLEFDGGNDYVSTGVTVGTTFTWAAWIKQTSQSGYDSILTIPNSGGANDSSYMLMDVLGVNASFWANDGMSGHNLGITGLVTDQWHHIVLVRRGNNMIDGYTGYLDGVRQGSRNSGAWVSSDSLWIGGRRGVSTQHFHGVIDDVRIYQRALCDDEITGLADEGNSDGVRIIRWVEIQ